MSGSSLEKLSVASIAAIRAAAESNTLVVAGRGKLSIRRIAATEVVGPAEVARTMGRAPRTVRFVAGKAG